MPGFNKSGPLGIGPRTGKGFGPCGLGGRFGFGVGRGLGGYFGGCNRPLSKEDQVQVLTDYKKVLEEELNDVREEEKKLSGEK